MLMYRSSLAWSASRSVAAAAAGGGGVGGGSLAGRASTASPTSMMMMMPFSTYNVSAGAGIGRSTTLSTLSPLSSLGLLSSSSSSPLTAAVTLSSHHARSLSFSTMMAGTGGTGKDDKEPPSSADDDSEDGEDKDGKGADATQEVSRKAKVSSEKASGPSEEFEFKAETRKLLDIVAGSLYSDKEVFIRELVSNCSDAIEKLRHASMTGGAGGGDLGELRIDIEANGDGTIVIQDNGIGMTRAELVDNLGTIAKSGSLAFLEELQKSGKGAAASSAIIGKFGVGFYSSFIVADSITVFSKSAVGDGQGYCWTSDGSGKFSLAPADGVQRGTKIVIKLRAGSTSFSEKATTQAIIKKYSNYVSFPIYLNGERVNTVEALWMKNKSEITPEQHNEFFRFIHQGFDDPYYSFHFSADAPLSVRALFYVPEDHFDQKMGFGRMDPQVSLFSRKVLIEKNSKNLLPDYLRFIVGVVDSEDIQLNLSREFTQDKVILNKLRSVLTSKVLRFLSDEAKSNADKYNKFFAEFGNFIKEGVCTQYENKDQLVDLLRYESSTTESGKVTSLKDYAERMRPEQKEIYYLVISNRGHALSSPYYDTFKDNDIEVLFLYDPIDDLVMGNAREYKAKKLVAVENADTKQSIFSKKAPVPDATTLKEAEVTDLVTWMKDTLGKDVVRDVKVTERKFNAPALIVGHESTVQRLINARNRNSTALDPQILEINPDHKVIKALSSLRSVNKPLAETVAHQIFGNATIAAGLVLDPRPMLGRLNTLLEQVMDIASPKGPSSQ